MKPFVAVNGQTKVFEKMNWDLLDYWITRFKTEGRGFDNELQNTRKWLQRRIRMTGDKELDQILNRNLFFNFFFASGMTLDTEE